MMGLLRWCSGKESTCQSRRCRRLRFSPWVGKIPWIRKWQLNPVFLPGEFHRQRSLAGYRPWGHEELDTKHTQLNATWHIFKIFIMCILHPRYCPWCYGGYKMKNSHSQNKVTAAQSCLILCDPMGCSLTGSSVYGILQARTLEWVVIPFSRGSSQPKDHPGVSHISGRFFTIWATREAKNTRMGNLSLLHGNVLTQEWKRGLLHFWWILHQLSYQGSPCY